MSALKVYSWEWKQFPWQWHVEIKPEYRRSLTLALAKHWGLTWARVAEVTRGNGHADKYGLIKLPGPTYPCKLGLIIHELAHLYDGKVYKGNGHRASFKKSVIKLQVEVRTYRLLPPIFAAIRRDKAAGLVQMNKATTRAMARAERLAEARRLAHSPARRLQATQERVKRLRTRIKRLQTALKKAERQERRLNRVIEPVMG